MSADPAGDLARFLDGNGVGPWVTDDLGRCLRVEDWCQEFLAEVAGACADDDHDEAELLRELRAELAANPTRKSISTKKLRDIIGDE